MGESFTPSDFQKASLSNSDESALPGDELVSAEFFVLLRGGDDEPKKDAIQARCFRTLASALRFLAAFSSSFLRLASSLALVASTFLRCECLYGIKAKGRHKYEKVGYGCGRTQGEMWKQGNKVLHIS